MRKWLKALCELHGASGNEERVKDFIKSQLADRSDEVLEDGIGNLVLVKKGTGKIPKKLMLLAHTDEVGLMVTNIEDDGRLAVMPVGGVDPRVLLGKRVVIGEKDIPGFIGFKAIHLQKEAIHTPPDWKDIRVEAGFSGKDEASEKVQIGNYIHFYSPFEEFENRIIGKALDDRGGCALLMDLFENLPQLDYDLCFGFVVQEEVGLRGSGAAAKMCRPDVGLVFETTTAGDNPELSPARWSTILDHGVALSYLQGGYALDYRIFELLVDTASRNQIPYQCKGRIVGGTDATRLAKTLYGIPCGGLNLPGRYIHAPVTIASKSDYQAAFDLAKAVLLEGKIVQIMEGLL